MAKILLPVPAELEDDPLPCPKGFDLTTLEVADFVAGFMFGFTGHDDKADMEQCFKDTPEFRTDMCNVYANLVTKDNQKVLEAIQKFMSDLPKFQSYMAGCSGKGTVSADFAVLSNWFKGWKAQGEMKIYSIAYHNLLEHMSEIKADISTMEVQFG